MEQADFDHAIDDEYSWTSVLEDLQHSVHVRSITSLTTNLQVLKARFIDLILYKFYLSFKICI